MTHKNLHVCLLVNELARAGAQTLILSIIQNTPAEADIQYTVCYIEGSDALAPDLREAGVRVVNFRANYKFDPQALARIATFFRQENFDVLHTHLPYSQSLGRVFGRIGGCRHIVSTQHSAPNNYHPLTRVLERVTRPLDDRTIAVSKVIERLFTGDAQEYQPGQQRQWCTIYNGINVKEFGTNVQSSDVEAIRSEWGIREGTVFLSVGRYIPAKSQYTLIEAMRYVTQEIPDAQLLIVGEGELKENLQEYVRKHDLEEEVHVTGYQHPLHPFYHLADVFVLSSIRESFGIVLLEAMAAKLPVVATDVQGIPEIVYQGVTGIIVPPKSPGQMANAMVRLRDPELRQCLGNAGYERARRRFDISRTVTHHLSLYHELCHNDD